ncbi:MAG: hypothetical protein ABIP71_02545, partial [Verrucomicrobiota bacterium]
VAIEGLGAARLQKITGQLAINQKQRVIAALTEVYSKHETFDEVMAMESIYDRRYTLSDKISGLRSYFSARDIPRKIDLRMKYLQTRIGLFLVDLAIQNYKTEKSDFPKTLDDLVPNFLPFLPKDNFSGNNFIYRPQSNGFLLYGVGYDGKDDGGKPLSDGTIKAKGDMLTTSRF